MEEDFNNNNNNKRKFKIDKGRIITDALTISLVIIIVVAVFASFIYIALPLITGNSSLSEGDTLEQKAVYRFKEALNRIRNEHIEEFDVDKLVDGAISGMAAATEDPYTQYLTNEEFEEVLNSGDKDKYGGLGTHISFDSTNNAIIIVGIMPDSPAAEAGLQKGDLIIKVEGETVTKENYAKSVDALKGEENTKVKLTIKRGNETFDKEVTRKIIATNNTESELLDGNIAYIKIWSFDNGVTDQFKAEYNKLLEKSNNNLKGIIIDLRNNPGGLVDEAVALADFILPKCDIVKLVRKDGSEEKYTSTDNEKIDLPIVVLTNSSSASAAEILSGAIKDSNRGVLVGEKTYGKGIVQTIQRLSLRGALEITTAKYYTASGVEIHKNGIEPNIEVKLPENVTSTLLVPRDQDTQLNRAIEYINTSK